MNIVQRNLQKNNHRGKPDKLYKAVALCMLPLLLFGCAGPVAQVQSTVDEKQSLPSTTVYFYPNKGQSVNQQERDRYECYLWSVDQTSFDPGQQDLTPHQRVEVKASTPPGTDVAIGAVTGAALGSLLTHPHAGPEGLVFGLIAGSFIGIASELGKQDQVNTLQQQYDDVEQQRYSQLEKQATGYRRAISACLEGRGYTVQ